MITAWLKKQKEKWNNDRGSAIVLVIIAIAFVGTLIAMLVYTVYFNYLMKYTDRSAKNNFYTAETALGVIKAGLEQDVSDAMVVSYYDVMSNNTSDSALNKQAAFEDYFRDELDATLGIASVNYSGATQTVYDPAKLADYWNRITRIGDASYEGFRISPSAGSEGARMEILAWDAPGAYGDLTELVNNGPVVIYSGSVMEFKNVKVSYTDADGYVSIVETDITIETPKINFANVLSLPDLESYSLVAADGIYNGYSRSSATFEPQNDSTQTQTVVTGNVYGGDDGIFVNGVNGQISFEKKAGDPDTRIFTLTADKISSLSGRDQNDVSGKTPSSVPSIKVDEFYEVWARDLYVESATLDIEGNCFIQDDLTTDGSYSGVYLSGIYNGYGTAIGTASANSSILINGAHTTLDLSQLKQLNLAGHAYVGSIHYNANENDAENGDYIEDIDAYLEEKEKEEEENNDGSASGTEDEDEDEIEENTNDVLMGQSLAVKSDQLMYMVPVECMGYDGDTQILAKNPMTYSEYAKFASTYETEVDSLGNVQTTDKLKYTVVRLDVVMNKVGGSINSYGASYVPVFRRVNDDILVYFYLKFASDDKANQFFRDYYAADQEAFDNYIENYLDEFRINSDIMADGSGKLSIAGNMLYMRNGRVLLAEDTFEEDLADYDAIEASRNQNALYYQNLSKYLMKTTDDLAALQLKNNVFNNIAVSAEEFKDQVSVGTFRTYKNTDDKVVALVVNNDTKGVFDFGASNSQLSGVNLDDVHLIIATGDVRVNVREFEGLILCGGDIYIGQNNERIDYNAAEVQKAMTAKNSADKYAFEVIQNGIAYANSLGTTDAELLAAIEAQKQADIIRASDLVKFTNWNKE